MPIPKYVFWRSVNASSFESMGASDVNVPELNLEQGPYRSTLKATRVSADYFHVFGAEMMLGRTFSACEDGPGGPNVVVISNELWQRYFRSKARPVGARILLNTIPYTVVGVLTGDAHFESIADVWFALRADPDSVDFIPRVRVVARMRNGLSVDQAQNVFSHAIDWSGKRPAKADLEDAFTSGFSEVISLRDAVVSEVRPSLFVLMGAAGFMLAIRCLNVATIFLGRSSRCSREIAVRLAEASVDSGGVPRRNLRVCSRLGRWTNFVGGFVGGCRFWLLRFDVEVRPGIELRRSRTLIEEK